MLQDVLDLRRVTHLYTYSMLLFESIHTSWPVVLVFEIQQYMLFIQIQLN